jgi:uncharacterized protein YicC (UPF0701 family)
MPLQFDGSESDLRAVIRAGVARGHLQIHVGSNAPRGRAAALNRALLDTYVQAFRQRSNVRT